MRRGAVLKNAMVFSPLRFFFSLKNEGTVPFRDLKREGSVPFRD